MRLCRHGLHIHRGSRGLSVVASTIAVAPLMAKAFSPMLLKGVALARAALVPIGYGLGVAAYRLRPLGTSGDSSGSTLTDWTAHARGTDWGSARGSSPVIDSSSLVLSKKEAEALFVKAGCEEIHAGIATQRYCVPKS